MLDILDTARARREAELVRRGVGDTAVIASTLLCWKYVPELRDLSLFIPGKAWRYMAR